MSKAAIRQEIWSYPVPGGRTVIWHIDLHSKPSLWRRVLRWFR